MKQVERLQNELESKYKVPVAKFLELYKNNESRESIAQILGTTEWLVRTYAATLNLRLPKRHRHNDYSLYLSRFDESTVLKVNEELTVANDNLESLSKQLISKEKQLIKSRTEVSKYRASLKDNIVLDDFILAVDEAISSIKPIEPLEVHGGMVNTTAFTKHKQFILLSDLHFEEIVSKDDVGSNEYNWGIAESRLNSVFMESMDSYRGESEIVVMCGGDMLDGLIHSSLETAGKPLGQAVADLAMLLSKYLIALSDTYPIVTVPCVSGNHERITDYKRSHNQGFGFAYLLYQMIKSLVANYKNIIVDISTTGFVSFGNNGLFHGDYIKATGDIKFLKAKEAFRQATGTVPHNIFCGHTHCFSVEEMTDGGKYITNGSLIGSNSYSTTNGMLGKSWGQVIGTWLPNGNIEYVRLVQS